MIKIRIRNIVFLLLFLTFTMPVRAAEDTVTLTADGNKVEAVLLRGTGEAGTEDEIVSLQMSFQLSAEQGELAQNKISFVFDSSVKSDVKQYRYQPETGVLSIYISGNEHITGKGNASENGMILGKIVIDPAAGASGIYAVKVKEKSLSLVNGAFYMESPDVYAQIEEKVRIGDTDNDSGEEDSDDKKDDDWTTGDDDKKDDNLTSGGDNDKYDDWYFDKEDKRIPISSNSSQTSGIYTTSKNPGPFDVNVPNVTVNTNNQQNPPGNRVTESSIQLPESTESQLFSENSRGPSGAGSGSDGKSSEDGSEKSGESTGSTLVVSGEANTEKGADDAAVQETEKTGADVQPQEEPGSKKKSNTVIWMAIVLAAVVAAAGVAVVLALKKQQHSGRKDS